MPPDGAPPDRRLAIGTGVVLAIGGAALVIARAQWTIPVGRAVVGAEISDLGFAIQLAALAGGAVAIHVARGPAARRWFVAAGAVCLLAYGASGLALGLGLVAWWAVLGARRLGRARIALAAALLGALDACAWGSGALASAGLLFSMMFTLRLIVFTYDRWQHDLEPAPLLDFLAFMLPAPLVIVPPYLAIIPLFGGFDARLRPGLTMRRLRQIARHAALAAVFAGIGAALERAELVDRLAQPATMYGALLVNIVDLATLGHLLVAMLLLHGVDERLPLDRPLLATRFVQFWQRFNVHLKDAQVFLFYTPALLLLRRRNRYLAIALAAAWTMVVGNTLLHIAARYCFLPDPWRRIGWALAGNAVLAAALAADLCYEEWRHRRGAPPVRSAPRWALGWALTMTLAAIPATL